MAGYNYRAFWQHKRGAQPEDWEDCFAADSVVGRFAVADGATASVFAKYWAERLTFRFVQAADHSPDEWADWLPRAQEDWIAECAGREVPWYTQEKIRDGDFATFVGLALTPGKHSEVHWQAVAVGDACLFHTRGDQLLKAFPVQNSVQFNNAPFLVSSKMPADDVRDKRSQNEEGTAIADDRLWLMTDALAQWFLQEYQDGNTPWLELEQFQTPHTDAESFTVWIEQLRDSGALKNDDVTLLVVDI